MSSLFRSALRGAVTGADAYRATRAAVRLEDGILRLGNRFVRVDRFREIAFLAFGNASASQSLAVNGVLGDRLTQGFAAGPIPIPRGVPFRSQIVREGFPGSSEGESASAAALELAGGLKSDDLLIVLLSPGALGALGQAPRGWDRVTWRAFLQGLERSGARGRELAVVSRVLGGGATGGGLGRMVSGTTVATLVLDRGDGGGIVGGGPTQPVRPEERTETRAILARVGALGSLPSALQALVTPDGALPSGVPDEVHRTVAIAGPADALRGASDAVIDRKWAARLGAVTYLEDPVALAARWIDRVEEVLARLGGVPNQEGVRGLAVFAGATLGTFEGIDERAAMDRFLAEASRTIRRRGMSVGVLRTFGSLDDDARPPGGFVSLSGTSGAAPPPDRSALAMRAGITDVGCVLLALVPPGPAA